MNKILYLLMILFSCGILIFVRLNILKINNIHNVSIINTRQPTYRSRLITISGYTSTGKLSYKINSDYIFYLDRQKITWLVFPQAILFNKYHLPIWYIKADKGKLFKKKMLYLIGHVQLNNLSHISYLKHIKTENIVINLITKEIFSYQKVNVYGIKFHSTGMYMYINTQNKILKLSKQVKTFYEVDN